MGQTSTLLVESSAPFSHTAVPRLEPVDLTPGYENPFCTRVDVQRITRPDHNVPIQSQANGSNAVIESEECGWVHRE